MNQDDRWRYQSICTSRHDYLLTSVPHCDLGQSGKFHFFANCNPRDQGCRMTPTLLINNRTPPSQWFGRIEKFFFWISHAQNVRGPFSRGCNPYVSVTRVLLTITTKTMTRESNFWFLKNWKLFSAIFSFFFF